jgi:hypothetical protein
MEPGNKDCQPMWFWRLRGARAGTVVGQLSLDEEEAAGAVLASRDRPRASPPLPLAPS